MAALLCTATRFSRQESLFQPSLLAERVLGCPAVLCRNVRSPVMIFRRVRRLLLAHAIYHQSAALMRPGNAGAARRRSAPVGTRRR